ncbi:MAG: SDR family NAD(P)-dependent oxidoreductase [Clostridia bacterium]|nr:SDR family NAD(P)-dependent oxidoreductase [Clostridia bacterium]
MKTALVTGGTSGIGLSVARGLCSLGWQVLVVGSSKASCQRAASSLKGKAVGEVHFFAADLIDPQETAALCEQLQQFVAARCQGLLDAVIFNAGAFMPSAPVASDGLEGHLALHCISAHRLWKGLAAFVERARGRVIFSGSSWHQLIGNADPQSLFSPPYPKGLRAYALSKLGVNWLGTALCKAHPTVSFYVVDPSWVYTGLMTKHTASFLCRLLKCIICFGISSGKAASTYITLCQANPPLPPLYYADRKRRSPSPLSQDEQKAASFLALCRQKG